MFSAVKPSLRQGTLQHKKNQNQLKRPDLIRGIRDSFTHNVPTARKTI